MRHERVATTPPKATPPARDTGFVETSCGINDVWRGFQGRTAEAVGEQEFAEHYTAMLQRLTPCSRFIVCLTETPFGPIDDPAAVAAMNGELAQYNRLAAQAAASAGALLLDIWEPFTAAARHLASAPAGQITASLWSDGVHLSELGDALMLRQIETFLTAQCIIDRLLDPARPGSVPG